MKKAQYEKLKRAIYNFFPKPNPNDLVCVNCGNEVSVCEHYFGSKREIKYFCGYCGEYGSHQPAVKFSNWQKARKLLGLSTDPQ